MLYDELRSELEALRKHTGRLGYLKLGEQRLLTRGLGQGNPTVALTELRRLAHEFAGDKHVLAALASIGVELDGVEFRDDANVEDRLNQYAELHDWKSSRTIRRWADSGMEKLVPIIASTSKSAEYLPIATLTVIYAGDDYRVSYAIEGPEELTAKRPRLVINEQPVETAWAQDDPRPLRDGNKALQTEPLYIRPLDGMTKLVVNLSWLCEISPVFRVNSVIDGQGYQVASTLSFFSVTVRVRRLELE